MLKYVLAGSLVALMSTGANAQQVCGQRTDVVSKLDSDYKESTTGMGLVNNGSVVEVFASQSGTWTILVTQPNGVSCVVATGEAWESVTKNAKLGPTV